MARMQGKLVQIVYPPSASTDVALDDVIKVQFSMDMNINTINSNTIRLLDDNLSPVPLTVFMDQSNPRRLAIAVPDQLLNPETRYKVVVVGGEEGVRSVDVYDDGGAFLYVDHSWNFTTGSKDVLSAPVLTYPSNDLILSSKDISFSWSSVEGAERYNFQISTDKSFSKIILNEDSISTNSYYPNTDLSIPVDIPGGYFWRVRAISSEGSFGIWSAIHQYYIDEESTSYDNYDSVDILEVVSTFPASSETFVSEDIHSIAVEFNHPILPESVTEVSFFVKAKKIDFGGQGILVPGDILVEDNKILFSPIDPLEENTEYQVYITEEIKSTEGASLEERMMFRFLTNLSPCYSMAEIIRGDLGTFVDTFSDIDITIAIYRTSLWADQIANKPYGSQNDHLIGEVQRSSDNKIFFHEYVRYETGIKLLLRRIMDHSIISSESKQLGDLSIKKSGSLVPDINVVMKRLEQLRDAALKKLTEGFGTKALPTSTILGGQKDPYPYGRNRERF